MNVRRHERRAISPIVATVLIVAATLIAFAAVAGYVFGIFGSASSTANVAVNSISLAGGAGTGGKVTLTNTGTGSTSISDVSLTYSGQTCLLSTTGTYSPVLPQLIGAAGTTGANGATQTLTYTLTAAGKYCGSVVATSGVAFNGYVVLANGEQATFTGTFS